MNLHWIRIITITTFIQAFEHAECCSIFTVVKTFKKKFYVFLGIYHKNFYQIPHWTCKNLWKCSMNMWKSENLLGRKILLKFCPKSIFFKWTASRQIFIYGVRLMCFFVAYCIWIELYILNSFLKTFLQVCRSSMWSKGNVLHYDTEM